MKKTVISGMVSLALFSALSTPATARNACETVLCLYGKVKGESGGNDCKGPEKDFFNIVKKNKHGFLPNHTFEARSNFLMECADADPKYISEILNKFGKVKL